MLFKLLDALFGLAGLVDELLNSLAVTDLAILSLKVLDLSSLVLDDGIFVLGFVLEQFYRVLD